MLIQGSRFLILIHNLARKQQLFLFKERTFNKKRTNDERNHKSTRRVSVAVSEMEFFHSGQMLCTKSHSILQKYKKNPITSFRIQKQYHFGSVLPHAKLRF